MSTKQSSSKRPANLPDGQQRVVPSVPPSQRGKKPGAKVSPSGSAAYATPMQGMVTAARQLFGPEGSAHITTTEGLRVDFHPARMKHLEPLIGYMGEALKGMGDESLLQLVAASTALRARGAADGLLQTDIDAQADHLTRQLSANADAIMGMAGNVVRILPKVCAMFTSLTEEEFDELTAVDASAVALGIFSVNYSFFSLSLFPILRTMLGTAVQDASKPTQASTTNP